MASIKRVSFLIGTAGHIDHGKTSLVKALTGIDTDRLPEEKKRGVSIDIGFAHMDLQGPSGETVRAGVVDVPGHERFIKNMLAGTTGIDMVLFVVAADDGIMPQTLEHLDIVRLLGITRGVFAVTKIDLAGPGRVKEVMSDIEALVKGTSLEGSPVIAVSSVTGEGVGRLKELIGSSVAERSAVLRTGFLRLPIDRSFTIKGAGTVVTGTVSSGTIKRGDEVILYPKGVRVRARGLQSLYMEVDEIHPGERAAVNITGASHSEIERGFVLASTALKDYPAPSGRVAALRVDAVIELMASRPIKGTLCEFAPVRSHSLLKLYHFTSETIARVVFHGRKEAMPGEKVYCRLILKEPLLMLRGDRFILRDPSRNITVGGGSVLAPYVSNELIPAMEKTHYRALEGADAVEVLKALIPAGYPGMEKKAASMMLNIGDTELDALISRSGGELSALGPYVVEAKRAAEAGEKVKAILSEFHKARPGETGMAEEDLLKGAIGRDRRKGGLKEGLLRETIKANVEKGSIKKEGHAYGLPSHAVALTGAEAAVYAALKPLFSKGLATVGAEELKRLSFRKDEIEKALRFMQKKGEVVRLSEGNFLSAEAVATAREKLTGYLVAKGSIKAADFRDLLGCGRKLAIEILEHFDRERVTLRQGDVRTLRR